MDRHADFSCLINAPAASISLPLGLQEIQMRHAERLRQLVKRHDCRVAPPPLQVADVLLAEPRPLGKFFLGQTLGEPELLGVSSHQPPHVHAEGLGGRCQCGLSPIVVTIGNATGWPGRIDHAMPNRPQAPLASAPPGGDALTDYDRAHLVTYLKLLDADAMRARLEGDCPQCPLD